MRTPPCWHEVANVAEVASPGLLVYAERVEENIKLMLREAGAPDRLRPHIKTHKMPEVIRMQMAHGIKKFKCATLAEAEMAAECGAPDLLLAYQPVGPNVAGLLRLVKTFPKTRFSTIVDDSGALRSLSALAARENLALEVLLDLD